LSSPLSRILRLTNLFLTVYRYAARWWYEFCRRRAVYAASVIKRSRLVVTNRLHGHILSCLLGVPNVVLDNTYGKNSAYYRCWYRDLQFARLIEHPTQSSR
jgi:pyruvyl transferase EpsO